MMWSMGPPSTGAPTFPCQLKERKEKKTEKQKSDTKHKHDLCLMKNILLMAIFITVSQGQKMNRNLGLAVMAGS